MIAIIAAYSKNRVIGKNGHIPWRIKGEQNRFRQLTTGNVVIMGRRTYEEIGYPLPKRYNIVVSNTKQFLAENCTTARSLTEAIGLAKGRDIFISGGEQLYLEGLQIADTMFITEIDSIIEGDTYFPKFDNELWERKETQQIVGELSYAYVTFVRKLLLSGTPIKSPIRVADSAKT